MPIKSPFKRSLLNVQPIPETPEVPAISNLSDRSAPNSSSGYDETSIGFSAVITRQVPVTSDSADAIPLTGLGVGDSQLASTVAADPERPELISLAAPFRSEKSSLEESLRLRDFEASMDESDISYIYARLMESEILKDIEKRYEAAETKRSEMESLNESLMEIVSKIEKFRDNSDFLLNNYSIHKGSIKYLSQLPRRFGESVETVNPTLEKTFLNLEGVYKLSSTSLVNLLVYTLFYPGSVKFTTNESGNSSLSRFNVPIVTKDPVNHLLTSLAGLDVTTAEGYLAAETLLPQDPVSRIALISEVLSYELSISSGTRRLGVDSIINYIQQSVGSTSNVVTTPTPEGTVVSSFRSGNTLLLETRDTTVDGLQYPGSLTALVDSSVANGSLDFSSLQSLTQTMNERISKLLQDILVLRALDEKNETISPTGIIVSLAEAVRKGSETIETYVETGDANDLSQQQVSQILLFKELANSAGSNEILESRFRTFLDILTSEIENVTVEDSAVSSGGKEINTTREKFSTGESTPQKTVIKLKSNIEGAESVELEVESSTVEGSVKIAEFVDAGNVSNPSISSMTTLSYGSGMGGQIVQQAVKTMRGTTNTASTTTDASSYSTTASDNVRTESFTGSGGSGHLSSTYENSFDLLTSNSTSDTNSATRSDIFERYGLTLGIAGLLGIGDSVRRSLSGEDLTLTLESLLSVGVSSSTSVETSETETFPAEEGDRMTVSNTQSAQSETVYLSNTASQSSKEKLLAAFGTTPKKRTNVPGNSSSKSRSKRSSYSLAGTSSVLSKNYAVASKTGGQILPSPSRKREQDTVASSSKMLASSEKSVRSENIYGLSNDKTGVESYSREISKTGRSKSPPQRETSNQKSDYLTTKEDTLSVIDSIGNPAFVQYKTTGFAASPRYVDLSSLPDSGNKQVSSTYKPFLSLFKSSLVSSSQLSYVISMQSLKESLKIDNVYRASLLSGAYRNFVDSLLRSAGGIAGNENAFLSQTSNYGISRNVIEFLCFSMFTSVCSFLSGVTGQGVTISGREDFDIFVSPQSDTLPLQQNIVRAISKYSGPLSELIMTFEGYQVDITVFESLRYAEKVTEITKSRWSVLQSFLSSYSSTVAELSALSSKESIVGSISKIVSNGDSPLLSEISYETVTNSQLVALKMRGPLKLDRRIRQYRTASSCVPLFLKGYSYETARDSIIASVGIPSKSLEFLRRKYQSDANISVPLGKEYIEVTFTKQDVQFPDLVLRSSTYRFCPVLEVVPQPTATSNLQTAMEDFLYLCHNGTEWETKGLSDALEFVAESTGLDDLSSYILIVNHVIDALCNLTSFTLGSIDTSETIFTPNERIVSSAGAEVLLKLMKSSVGAILPRGSMLPGDFLRSDSRGYRFLRFSKLDPGTVKLTNDSSHRLLGQVVTDPLFTAENLYKLTNCFTPFERTYNCVIDPDEFLIDKQMTLATSSGRATFDLLVNQGALEVYPEVAIFKEGTNAKILEGSTYASKVELVTK